MIEIGVLTTTRAEYGLLRSLIFALNKESDFNVNVLVSGTHLSKSFGSTYKEIEKDGIEIAAKIEILDEDDTAKGMSYTMAAALRGFSDYFENSNLDALIVLGDRYETLAVCCAALNCRIPIIHLHGGETTEGAIDEAIRHSITKMSCLHFTSTETYRKRVIQLGENPNKVYNVGAIGVENVKRLNLLSQKEVFDKFGVNKPYFVMIFHPITLEDCTVEEQIGEVLNAIDEYAGYDWIILKANADAGGRQINELLENYAKCRENIHLFASLNVIDYLSAAKYSEAVIGNSSSGIIEIPSFSVPTVNIGDRQKGRERSKTVIDCECEKDFIVDSIATALTNDFKEKISHAENPYEKGDTIKNIVEIIKNEALVDGFLLKKKFYDIKFEV